MSTTAMPCALTSSDALTKHTIPVGERVSLGNAGLRSVNPSHSAIPQSHDPTTTSPHQRWQRRLTVTDGDLSASVST